MSDEADDEEASRAHFKIIEQIDGGLGQLIEKTYEDKDIYEQLELFQYKFPDIDRDELTEHLRKFQKYSKKLSYVNEPQAMALMGITAVELWSLFPGLKESKNHRLDFLEYLCVLFNKSFAELNSIKFNSTIQDALLEVRAACLEARAFEDILREHDAKEMERKELVSALTGKVADSIAETAAAFGKGEEPDVKRAALEKDVKEAKKRERASLTTASRIIDEEIKKIDLQNRTVISSAVAEIQKKEKLLEEKKARDARKAEIQKKWESPSTLPPRPASWVASASRTPIVPKTVGGTGGTGGGTSTAAKAVLSTPEMSRAASLDGLKIKLGEDTPTASTTKLSTTSATTTTPL